MRCRCRHRCARSRARSARAPVRRAGASRSTHDASAPPVGAPIDRRGIAAERGGLRGAPRANNVNEHARRRARAHSSWRKGTSVVPRVTMTDVTAVALPHRLDLVSTSARVRKPPRWRRRRRYQQRSCGQAGAPQRPARRAWRVARRMTMPATAMRQRCRRDGDGDNDDDHDDNVDRSDVQQEVCVCVCVCVYVHTVQRAGRVSPARTRRRPTRERATAARSISSLSAYMPARLPPSSGGCRRPRACVSFARPLSPPLSVSGARIRTRTHAYPPRGARTAHCRTARGARSHARAPHGTRVPPRARAHATASADVGAGAGATPTESARRACDAA